MTDPKKARCFDPEWRYTPANATDISKLFARVRRQLKEAEAVKQAANVKPIRDKRSSNG